MSLRLRALPRVLPLALLLAAACGDDAAPPDDAGNAPDAGPGGDAGTTDDAAPTMADAAPGVCLAPAPCPTSPVPGVSEGGGLVAADICQVRLVDTGDRAARAAMVADLETALPRVPLADVVADANRTGAWLTTADLPGVTGFSRGFAWNAGDGDVTYWIPQGLSGSGDAYPTGLLDGREVALVTWYYKQDDPGAPSTVERGVRISVVDLSGAAPSYRHALLVDPVVKDGRADFAAVPVHAGGVVWLDHWLYVPVTGNGFRVFDLDHILRVDTAADGIGWDPATGSYRAWGYQYVVPQVATYGLAPDSCPAVFSFVSLERTTTSPPSLSLLSGEYDADADDHRLFRWALAADGALAAERPTEAWYAGQTRVQGAAAIDGTYFLSCSSQGGPNGALYRATPGAASTAFTWPRGPEDLSFWPGSDELWTLTEFAGTRKVFGVDVTAYR